MKKISIIIPAYNVENRIDLCLSSIENSSYKNLEIIVINDGSKDNTINIIKEHVAKYPELYVLIDRENKGISATRNEGLIKATGDYISFVDSDDSIEFDMYEKLVSALENSNSDIIVCGYKSVNDDNKIIEKYSLQNIKIDVFEQNPKLVHILDFAPWNKLYKKELFKDILFPLNTKYEDLSTIIKVFAKAKKIDMVDEPLYNYYINNFGETKSVNEKVFDILSILEDIVDYFKDSKKNIKKEIKYLCSKKVMDYLEIITSTGNDKLAVRFADKGYKFLKTNFKQWKINYLFNNINGIKHFVLKFIHINKWTNLIRIKLKAKNNRGI